MHFQVALKTNLVPQLLGENSQSSPNCEASRIKDEC